MNEPKPPSPAERQAAALEEIVGAVRELTGERRELFKASEAQRRFLKLEDEGYSSVPRRLHFGSFCKAVPGLASNFSRKIPPEFWSLDGESAVVACPCGEEPVIELGVATFCGGSDWIDEDRDRDDERDGCGRAYLYDGQAVRVAFSPAKPPTPAAS